VQINDISVPRARAGKSQQLPPLCLDIRLRNDLYCVEWDVKLYYTIPYHVSGHRARPTDGSSWCRHQRPSVGERPRHLSDYIVAQVCQHQLSLFYRLVARDITHPPKHNVGFWLELVIGLQHSTADMVVRGV